MVTLNTAPEVLACAGKAMPFTTGFTQPSGNNLAVVATAPPARSDLIAVLLVVVLDRDAWVVSFKMFKVVIQN